MLCVGNADLKGSPQFCEMRKVECVCAEQMEDDFVKWPSNGSDGIDQMHSLWRRVRFHGSFDVF